MPLGGGQQLKEYFKCLMYKSHFFSRISSHQLGRVDNRVIAEMTIFPTYTSYTSVAAYFKNLDPRNPHAGYTHVRIIDGGLRYLSESAIYQPSSHDTDRMMHGN